jgi:hypothetical protein
MIPKILLQTSRDTIPPKYVRNKLAAMTGDDWKYIHFTNAKMREYLNNAQEEFPLIIDLFDKLVGPHKSDLFRYYFLYKNGGVYIDTDAMLYKNINYLVENYDFFAVEVNGVGNQCFNGFIGSIPNSEIIKKATYLAYNTSVDQLSDCYHLNCKNLSSIIKDSNSSNIKLLIEKDFTYSQASTFDEDLCNPILIHYHKDKIIPK